MYWILGFWYCNCIKGRTWKQWFSSKAKFTCITFCPLCSSQLFSLIRSLMPVPPPLWFSKIWLSWMFGHLSPWLRFVLNDLKSNYLFDFDKYFQFLLNTRLMTLLEELKLDSTEACGQLVLPKLWVLYT